jgi:hypothetical protein
MPSFVIQDEVPKKGLTNPLNCSLLVVGVGHCGDKMREQFDGYVAVRDNQQIQKTLNGYQLPWFELYSSRFRYEKDVVRKPKRESQMIDKYSPKQLKAVKAAKTRYIFYNPSRRKMCGEFMTELATVLAAHVRGVLVEHIR